MDPKGYTRLVVLFLLLFTEVSFPRLLLAQDLSLEGGDTTVTDSSSQAYGQLLANAKSSAIQDKHDLGRSGFDRDFARTKVNGKIRVGPLFNNVSCVGCHINNGRGTPSFGNKASQSVIKVSLPSGKPGVPNGPVPLPSLGNQLHDHAISNVRPDVRIALKWDLIEGQYSDGTRFELRSPKLSISARGVKRLPVDMLTSLRRSPAVFGSGLLESIDQATILSAADPDDLNGDGISGRPNMVWDLKARATKIGRFGFKAAAPSVIQQIANAYAIDMGVTNPLVRLKDKQVDISQKILDATTFYTRTLAVPRSRSTDSQREVSGKAIFISIGCNSCHLLTLVTGSSDISELSHQTIHPLTDLLLHDMGSELDDGRVEFQALGSEWRTTPLWGIGLTATALAGAPESYLHDGRARTLEEAILWHGGEAQRSSDQFKALNSDQRDSLISFLRSL